MNPKCQFVLLLLVVVSLVVSAVPLKEDKIDLHQRLKRSYDGGYGGGAPPHFGGGMGGVNANIANVNVNQQGGCNGKGPNWQWAYSPQHGWICINIINVNINQAGK